MYSLQASLLNANLFIQSYCESLDNKVHFPSFAEGSIVEHLVGEREQMHPAACGYLFERSIHPSPKQERTKLELTEGNNLQWATKIPSREINCSYYFVFGGKSFYLS